MLLTGYTGCDDAQAAKYKQSATRSDNRAARLGTGLYLTDNLKLQVLSWSIVWYTNESTGPKYLQTKQREQIGAEKPRQPYARSLLTKPRGLRCPRYFLFRPFCSFLYIVLDLDTQGRYDQSESDQ